MVVTASPKMKPALKKSPKRLNVGLVKSVKTKTPQRLATSVTPEGSKKKFVKTPHPSKSNVNVTDKQETNDLKNIRKRRKLSFSEADSKSDVATETSLPKVKKAKREIVKQKKPIGKVPKKLQKNPDSFLQNNENTIFIGNLPCDCKKKDVIKLFSSFGKILSFRIRCAAINEKAKNRKSGVIKKQFQEGTTVCGYMKFESFEQAEKALAMNSHLFQEHHLRVDMQDPKGRKAVDKKKAIYVAHLPKDFTDDELWEFFKECGAIRSVRLIKDQNYLNKGVAFVNFESEDAVELALKLHGSALKGKHVAVARCSDYKGPTKNTETKTKKAAFATKKKLKTKLPKKEDNDTSFQGNKSTKKKKAKSPSLLVKKKKKIAEILTNK